jgi:hypothetical protein
MSLGIKDGDELVDFCGTQIPKKEAMRLFREALKELDDESPLLPVRE